MVSLASEDLEIVANAKEVVIETRSSDRVFRTVIWVTVDDGDVFVRSVMGKAGRWFRRAVADPDVTLDVGDSRFSFRALPVSDAGSVERASEGFRRKYPKGRSLDAMVRPEVLETTLLLEPVS
jgi:hypothetical protein